MTTYILAGGCDGDYPEYIVQLARVVRMRVASPRILSCGFSIKDAEAKVKFLRRKRMLEAGFGDDVTVIMAEKDVFMQQLVAADVVYFHGGNTNMLAEAMQAYPDIEKGFVDKVIIGSSAGANYLSSYGFSPSAGKAKQGSGIVNVATVVHYGSAGFSGKTFTADYWHAAAQTVRTLSGRQDILLLPEGTFAVIEQ